MQRLHAKDCHLLETVFATLAMAICFVWFFDESIKLQAIDSVYRNKQVMSMSYSKVRLSLCKMHQAISYH